MKRLCFCVSGQLRTSDDALVQLRDVTSGLDATFVFSVWEESGQKLHGALNFFQIVRIFDLPAAWALPRRWLGHDTVWRMLPDLYARLVRRTAASEGNGVADRIRRYFPDAIIDVESSGLLDLEFDHACEDKNSIKMLYKIWRANEIKRRIERRDGKFDFVVRTRPDLIVTHLDLDLITGRCDEGTILVDGFQKGNAFVHDRFAVGTSAVMDKYAALFALSIKRPTEWTHIHTDLHYHLENVGVAYDAYPHIGDYAEDTKVSCSEVLESLDAMEAAGTWSPGHEVTRRVLRAARNLQEGDVTGALGALAIEAPGQPDDVFFLDGCFFTLGRALLANGEPRGAALATLLAIHLRDRTPLWDQKECLQLLADAFLRLDGIDALDRPDDIVAALARGTLPAWTRPAVEAMLRASSKAGVEDLIRDPVHRLLACRDFFFSVVNAAPAALSPSFCNAFLSWLSEASRSERITGYADGGLWLDTPSIDDLFILAELSKRAHRFEEAWARQGAALAALPNHAGANRQMAEIGFNLGRDAEAFAYAQTAHREHPGELAHQALLAYACLRTGRQDQAEGLVSSLPYPLPAALGSLMVPGLGQTLDRCRLDWLVKRSGSEELMLHDRYVLADLLKRFSRFDEAWIHQAAALRQDPLHAGANRQMAEIGLNLGRFPEAVSHAEIACREMPDDLVHRALLCYACLRAGQTGRAADLAASLPYPLPPHLQVASIPDEIDVLDRFLTDMSGAESRELAVLP